MLLAARSHRHDKIIRIRRQAAKLTGVVANIRVLNSHGVVGIRSQFVTVLEKAGLERIEADGVLFDPNEHEAVMQDDGPGEPHVAETMRSGYRLKGRVVRPAMVRVTRA